METKSVKHYGVDVEVTYVGDNDMHKQLEKDRIEYIDIPNNELVDVVSYIKDDVKKYLIQSGDFWFKTLLVPDDGSWLNLIRDSKNQFNGAEAEIMQSKLAHDLQYVRDLLHNEESETDNTNENIEFDDTFASFGIKECTEEEIDEYWLDVILELKSRCGWNKERILKADKNGIGKDTLEKLESYLK